MNGKRKIWDAGEFRSEVKMAIPKLNSGDIEWLVAWLQTAIDEASTKSEKGGAN